MKQKGKTWIDSRGNTIDTWAINPVLKVEEKHSQKIADLALRAEKALQELNNAVDVAQKEVFEAKMKDADIKDYTRKPKPESLLFYAYDRSVTVDIKTSRRITFDRTYVELIKDKFDQFFQEFDKDEKNSDKFSFLREIVNTVMYKTNGEIDQFTVNQLRSHKAFAISKKFEGWKIFVEAVDLFDKAIRTEPGNRLYYVDVADENGKMRRVALKYTDL